jgi:hypothetical protein
MVVCAAGGNQDPLSHPVSDGGSLAGAEKASALAMGEDKDSDFDLGPISPSVRFCPLVATRFDQDRRAAAQVCADRHGCLDTIDLVCLHV